MTAIDPTITEKAQSWLKSNISDSEKEDIRQLMDNPEALTDAFYKDLEFGTGGLRGIMGIGSNRVNKYTIGMATQGLSNYLLQAFPDQQIKVAIAHDSRNKSRFFAETTAAVFSANGIKVFLFKELRPTPELSFAIRNLGCQSGVVCTASHNPKEYNGYKAYWEDGAQIVSPHDKNVIGEVDKIKSIDDVKFEANKSLIEIISDDLDEKYLDAVAANALNPEAMKNQSDLKIVFTPIHGTGITMVPRILEKLGFTNVHIVKEQATPDGNFPTVVYPNPEEQEAMSIALKQAAELDADLVMATDPDADRVGIAAKNHHGEWQLVNGNQTAALLVYYLLLQWKERGKLTSGNPYICNTIVTTDLIDKMAESHGVPCYNTLTGFKWIAAVIREKEGKETFIGGGEESYGFMIGDFVRDKDAVSACAMIAELFAYAKDNGKTLFDLLTEMYETYGMYREHLISVKKEGKSGAEEIQAMMKDMRANPPAEINGSKVVTAIDYKSLVQTDLSTGTKTAVDLPASNVLQFITADGSKISARPSGTEPKIKFYFSVNAPLGAAGDYDKVWEMLGDRIQGIIKSLGFG